MATTRSQHIELGGAGVVLTPELVWQGVAYWCLDNQGEGRAWPHSFVLSSRLAEQLCRRHPEWREDGIDGIILVVDDDRCRADPSGDVVCFLEPGFPVAIRCDGALRQ